MPRNAIMNQPGSASSFYFSHRPTPAIFKATSNPSFVSWIRAARRRQWGCSERKKKKERIKGIDIVCWVVKDTSLAARQKKERTKQNKLSVVYSASKSQFIHQPSLLRTPASLSQSHLRITKGADNLVAFAIQPSHTPVIVKIAIVNLEAVLGENQPTDTHTIQPSFFSCRQSTRNKTHIDNQRKRHNISLS